MKTLFLLVGLGILGIVQAEDPVKKPENDPWEAVTSRGKIEVEKLAFVEAKKKLIEEILTLQFEPKRVGGRKVTLGDLASEHKQILSVIQNTILKNVEPVGDARFLHDLTCEVKTGVLVKDIVEIITAESQQILADLQIDPAENSEQIKLLSSYNFQYIISYYHDEKNQPLSIVFVLGSAKVPEQYLRNASTVTKPTASPVVPVAVSPTSLAPPAWASQTLTVTGSHVLEPTALLMAQYEAIQKIQAISVEGKTTLGDILAAQPKARLGVFNLLSDGTIQSIKKSEGASQITLTVPLGKIYPQVKEFLPPISSGKN